jgi:ubiquinol-cytochrome c reductase iron-sulfur subunit
MAPLPTAAVSRTLAQAVRSNASSQTVRALSSTAARSVIAAAEESDTYKSPFKKADKFPDFSKYMLPKGSSNQLIGYFMVGTLGAISAAGAKSTVQGELHSPYAYPVDCGWRKQRKAIGWQIGRDSFGISRSCI